MDWSHDGRWVFPPKYESLDHEEAGQENIMEDSSKRERELSAQVRGKEVSASGKPINDKKMDFLSLNSMVEVRSNNQRLKGAWYAAKILESYSKPKEKLWLQYQSDPPITECVHISFIRPLPPPPVADHTYKLHDIVDAFHLNGWWKGIVSKVGVLEDNNKCRRYSVVLENPYQELDFSSQDLRFHLVWNDGKWDRLPNQETPTTEDCQKQSAHVDNTAYHSNVVPETEDSLYLAKKLRRENSVISLTPSVLMKSTKQATESTITKYMTCDIGANLPLDKGNNTSPNQHRDGPGNRSEEYSKTRETELNAQVTGQKVAATAYQEEEEQSSTEKSRKNLLESEQSTRQQKMPAHETEETLPNYSNKIRMENSPIPSSPDKDGETPKCSMFDKSGDGIAESSQKRERELDSQITGQQVLTAYEEEMENEDPAEDVNEGNAETFNQSLSVDAIDGQADSKPGRNKDPPFKKNSYMWKHIDSLEVFRILPQKPHFSYLSDCNEEICEGSAIGHMLSFTSLVGKVTKLQIDDPRSVFDRYLEALAILEEIGFDVKAVVDRVNELLILKRRQERLDNQLKRYQRLVAECDGKKTKLEQEIAAIDKVTMSGLEVQRAWKMSQMVKEDSNMEFLQLEVSSLKNAMFDVEYKFKVKSACPWHTST